MSALADQLLRDGYPNQAVLLGAAIEDGRRVMRRRTVLHVVTRGDSQALPRPIRYDQHSVENPYLAVRFDECFPAVFAGLLEDLSGRRVLSSNTSIRGADVGQYLSGVGIDTDDLFFSLEPEIFVSMFGYAETWRAVRRGGLAEVVTIAEEHVGLLMRHARGYPVTEFLILGLPPAGRRLESEFPEAAEALLAFNQRLKAAAGPNIRYVPPLAGKEMMHTDDQHYSVLGHRALAERLLDVCRELGFGL